MASPRIRGMTIADSVDATIAKYAPTRYHLCLKAYFIRRNTTLMRQDSSSCSSRRRSPSGPVSTSRSALRPASAMIFRAGTTLLELLLAENGCN